MERGSPRPAACHRNLLVDYFASHYFLFSFDLQVLHCKQPCHTERVPSDGVLMLQGMSTIAFSKKKTGFEVGQKKKTYTAKNLTNTVLTPAQEDHF